MEFKEIEATIKPGTKLAIFKNKLSSKEKRHKYFSGRWQLDETQAIKYWDKMIEEIEEKFLISTEKKHHEYLDSIRTEVTILSEK